MDSFPDPKKQFLCRGCNKWLDKKEIGKRLVNGAPDFNFLINSFAKSVSGLNDNQDRFICVGCYKKRKIRKIVIFSIFAIIVLTALILGK
jgi:hypothetical protein